MNASGRVRSVEPVQRGERRVELHREAELPFVALAFHVPNITSVDGPVLEVLEAILPGRKPDRPTELTAATAAVTHKTG